MPYSTEKHGREMGKNPDRTAAASEKESARAKKSLSGEIRSPVTKVGKE